MGFKILTSELLVEFTMIVKTSPLDFLQKELKPDIPVDYFQFYKSVSSVYSSKIEGEEIDFDSYFKHKFMNVKFKADYTKKADDLYRAYEFIDTAELNLENVKEAHSVQLEKNYYQNLNAYYENIRVLGLEYEELDYKNSLEFLLMTISLVCK